MSNNSSVSNREKELILNSVHSLFPELIEEAQGVIRINSINPDHDEGKLQEAIGGETKVSKRLASYMESAGMSTDLFSTKDDRYNAVGTTGNSDGRSLLFNGHVDVVGVGDINQWVISSPFGGEIINNRLYGRGSTDMKSGIVCAIAAVKALYNIGMKPRGQVIIEAVCGEENMDTSAGTGACIDRGYTADAGICLEPSGPPYRLAIEPATPGALTFEIWIQGHAGHTCMRDEICRAGGKGDAYGASAMDKAIFIYEGLRRLEEKWGFTKSHPVYTRPGHFTINPGSIYAGPTPYAITEEACLTYSAWYAPQEDSASVMAEIQDYVTKWCSTDDWLVNHPPKYKELIDWPSLNVPVDAPIVTTMKQSFSDALGRPAPVYGFAAVCDAAFLTRAGIPTVIMGPGDLCVAHGPDEYVELCELEEAAKVYALTIASWCGLSRL